MRKPKLLLILLFVTNFACIGYCQKNWTFYDDTNAVKLKYLNAYDVHILGVIEDVDGATWFITSRGINVYKNGKWSKIDETNHLIQNRISTYYVDSNNKIWIGTQGESTLNGYVATRMQTGGVSVYNINEDKWEQITSTQCKLPAPNVSIIFETSSGDIWFSLTQNYIPSYAKLYAGGLVQVSNGEVIVHKDNLPGTMAKFVYGIEQDKNGTIWFWSYTGFIFYFDKGQFYEPSKDEGYKSTNAIQVINFKDDEDNLWFAFVGNRNNPLGRWDGDEWKIFRTKDGFETVNTAFKLSDGKIALISYKDIQIQHDNNTFASYKYPLSKTYNNYCLIFDKPDLELRKYKNFAFYNGQSDDLFKKLRCMLTDTVENSLWIGTKNHLEYRINGSWNIREDIEKVWGLIKDSENAVWAFTKNDGVYKYSKDNWTHFNSNNGIDDRIGDYYYDSNDVLWLFSDYGTYIYE